MTNNDILRRIRFTFDYTDAQMIDIFAHAGHEVSRAQVCDWLKKEDDPTAQVIDDLHLAIFLNGFIIEKRGRKEGEQPVSETTLNNNIIFRKLKIALNFKDADILDMLLLADFRLGKHELSAFFRNPSQSQYRQCNNQVLRNFLHGVQLKYKQK